MNEELISVIITTYNRKEYLDKAIESVLAQTYQNFEIIVMDDHSTDGTEEYMQKYKEHEKITYYRSKKNRGPGINRKEAVNKMNGKYMCFLDDDDIFLNKEYFKKAIDLFKKYSNLSLVACNHIIYNTMSGERIEKNLGYTEVVDNKQFFKNFGKAEFPKPISSIFKKEAFELTAYKKMKIFNDTTIYLRALLYGPMGFINTYGTQYLIHGKNISFGCKVDFILDNLKEKYAVYLLAKKYFDFSKEDLKQWLIEQLDITIIYYIKGSKPNILEMIKIYLWVLMSTKDFKCVKNYMNIYKEHKDKGKQI